MDGLRLQLEGLALHDERGRLTATFRYRTRLGILVNLPESADALLPWEHLESCVLDLVSGELRLRVRPESLEHYRWLQGARELRGSWLDRVEIEHGL